MVAFGFVLGVLSFVSMFRSMEFVPAGLVGMAMIVAAPLFRSKRKPRRADVEVTSDAFVVSIRHRMRQRISLRELAGASTARVEGGPTLALRFGNATMPIVVQPENEQELKSLRIALDVGPMGTGTLVWKRGRDFTERIAPWIHWGGVVAAVGFMITMLRQSPHDLGAVTAGEIVFVVAYVIAQAARASIGTTIALTSSGVYVSGEGAAAYPWSSIANVEIEERAIVLTIEQQRDERFPPQKSVVRIAHEGLDADDLALVAEQIRAASARARGHMQPDERMAQTLLGPHEGESTADWIRRIDTLADGWRVSPPRHGEVEGYRVLLWATAENHDADPVVRALAARVLSRVDRAALEPKLRVVLETVRDPIHAARFRAAVEPEPEALVQSIEEWKRNA